ncbi:MAG: hypothetical protein ACP5LS_05200, partial [Thermoprotei archaeon]
DYAGLSGSGRLSSLCRRFRQSALTGTPTGRIWSVQVWNINGMTQQDYDNIASIGVNAVELQLYWSDIEPSVGTFDFTTLYANVK